MSQNPGTMLGVSTGSARVSKERATIIFRCRQWQVRGRGCSRKFCALMLPRLLLPIHTALSLPFTHTVPVTIDFSSGVSMCKRMLELRDFLEGVVV